jgi:hypothetical protein
MKQLIVVAALLLAIGAGFVLTETPTFAANAALTAVGGGVPAAAAKRHHKRHRRHWRRHMRRRR